MAEITVGATIGSLLGTNAAAASGTITGGQLDDRAANELLSAVTKNIVVVATDAPSRCIDGRPCVQTVAGGAPEPRPALAGGALVSGYAAALLTDWFGNEASQVDQLAQAHAVLTGAGLRAGTHCDEHAFAGQYFDAAKHKTATGCGADDRLAEILQKLQDEPRAVQALAASLLGDKYRAELLPSRAVAVDTWDPKLIIDEVADNASIEILASPADTPNHGHTECAVVFNYVSNRTLDRDAFVAASGKQVFSVDMWYLDKVAYALAAGANSHVPYEKLQHAMVAYQVATYLTLCDGSQRLIVLR
jgi:hypothetical protein